MGVWTRPPGLGSLVANLSYAYSSLAHEVLAVPVSCVIGLQWGDEAKGKLVDLLTDEHEIVVRYQGGANAGHTVVRGDAVYKLSLLPSGILTPGVTCVIAGGVVVNPATLLEELDGLQARGVAVLMEATHTCMTMRGEIGRAHV